MKNSRLLIFIIITFVFLVFEQYLFFHYLNFESLFDQNLIDKGIDDESIGAISLLKKGRLFLGVVTKVLSVLAVALLISIGCKLSHFKVSFKQIFEMTFISEMTIIISGFVNYFVLKSKINSIDSLVYLKSFRALSLQNFFSFNSISEELFIALGAVGVFQVLYVIALSYGLKLIIKGPFLRAMDIILASYVSVYIIITTGKLLLTLNFS